MKANWKFTRAQATILCVRDYVSIEKDYAISSIFARDELCHLTPLKLNEKDSALTMGEHA